MRYHQKAPVLVLSCWEAALGLSTPCFLRDEEEWYGVLQITQHLRTGSSACRIWSEATSLSAAGDTMNLPFHLRVRVAVPAVGQVRLEIMGWAQLKSQPGSSLPCVLPSPTGRLCPTPNSPSCRAILQHMQSLPRCRAALRPGSYLLRFTPSTQGYVGISVTNEPVSKTGVLELLNSYSDKHPVIWYLFEFLF